MIGVRHPKTGHTTHDEPTDLRHRWSSARWCNYDGRSGGWTLRSSPPKPKLHSTRCAMRFYDVLCWLLAGSREAMQLPRLQTQLM